MKAILRSVIITVLAVSCTSNPSPSARVLKRDSQPAKTPPHKSNSVKASNSIMPAIEGLYKAAALEGEESEPCDLTIEIKKANTGYFYTLTLPGQIKKGAVTIAKSDDPQQFTCMLTLEGIKWASYEGNISQQDEEHPAKELEVPVGISMGYINNELTFQNDGNAMNAYTVLQECDQKYVRLVKQ